MIPIPIDTEAERAVLAEVLMYPAKLDDVAGVVSPWDFHVPVHRAMWQAYLAVESGQLDTVSVTTAMHRAGTIGLVPDRDVGFVLTDRVYCNVMAKARRLCSVSRARKVWEAARAALDADALGEPDAWADALAAAVSAAAEITTDGDMSWGASVDAEMLSIEAEIRGNTDAVCVPPYWPLMTYMLGGGLRGGDLCILAARPGIGKSAMLLTWMRHVCTRKPVDGLLLNLEMTRHKTIRRALAPMARANMRTVVAQRDESALPRIRRAAEELRCATMESVETVRTIDALMAKVRGWRRRTKRDGRLAMVGVDYLQLVRVPRAENKIAEVAEVARSLKELAVELDVPIVALAQINRDAESATNSRPRMHHLAGSSEIEKAADIIGLIYRPSVHDKDAPPGHAEVDFVKQRDGETGTVHLTWVPEYTTFEPSSDRRLPG